MTEHTKVGEGAALWCGVGTTGRWGWRPLEWRGTTDGESETLKLVAQVKLVSVKHHEGKVRGESGKLLATSNILSMSSLKAVSLASKTSSSCRCLSARP